MTDRTDTDRLRFLWLNSDRVGVILEASEVIAGDIGKDSLDTFRDQIDAEMNAEGAP